MKNGVRGVLLERLGAPQFGNMCDTIISTHELSEMNGHVT